LEKVKFKGLTKFLCNDQKVIIYQTRFIIKKYFNTENDLNFLDQLQPKILPNASHVDSSGKLHCWKQV